MIIFGTVATGGKLSLVAGSEFVFAKVYITWYWVLLQFFSVHFKNSCSRLNIVSVRDSNMGV